VIDWTVSLGNIITILTVIASVIGLVYNMKSDIVLLQNDVTHLEKAQQTMTEAFSNMGKVLTTVAVQDNRLTMIEKKLDELSHGKGYVK